MGHVKVSGTPKIVQTLKQVAVSAFVAGTFMVYSIHDRMLNAGDSSALAPTPSPDASQANATPLTATQNASATASPLPTEVFSSSTPISSTELALSSATDAATIADVPPATNTPHATDVPPTSTDLPTATDVPPTSAPKSGYKDGTYTGPVTDAFYGNVQVRVIIKGGKITQIKFLDYPHDRRTSQVINNYAIPRLQQEVIQAQNLNVNIVSGATLTSEAFGQSMQAVLNQAQN